MPGDQRPDALVPGMDAGEIQVSPEAGLASQGLGNGYNIIVCSTDDSCTKIARFVLKLLSAFGHSF